MGLRVRMVRQLWMLMGMRKNSEHEHRIWLPLSCRLAEMGG